MVIIQVTHTGIQYLIILSKKLTHSVKEDIDKVFVGKQGNVSDVHFTDGTI